jgi:glutamine synthetase
VSNKYQTIHEIQAAVTAQKIRLIRLQYTDLLGVGRNKTVHVELLEELFGPGLAFCSASYRLTYDNDIVEDDDFSPTSDDLRVVADPATFRIFEGTGLLLGDLYYGGKPLASSPRGFLKRVIARYHSLGLEPVAATELEFFLYRADGSRYVDLNNVCYITGKQVDPDGFLAKLTDFFENLGLHPIYMNHEYYPSQFEFNWGHKDALTAADEGALFKTLTRELALANGLRASFMAKPRGAEGGSGLHAHLSLRDLNTGKNAFDDGAAPKGVSLLTRQFTAGVLKHADAITAFLSPTVNCYKRLQPDSFAPVWVAWGYDNRSTYVRVPNERGAASRVEVRGGSAAANPYLLLAGILAAGLDGIENKLEPPEVVVSDLYHDKTRQTHRIPTGLDAALYALEHDGWIADFASPELVKLFGVLKRHELDSYNRFVTDWEDFTYQNQA